MAKSKLKKVVKIINTACVIGVSRKYSRTNGEYFYTIEMIDPVSGDYLKTYASEDNYNMAHWDKIIERFRHNDKKKTIVLEGNIMIKKDNIVDADSKPRVINEIDLEEFLQIYYQTHLQ